MLSITRSAEPVLTVKANDISIESRVRRFGRQVLAGTLALGGLVGFGLITGIFPSLANKLLSVLKGEGEQKNPVNSMAFKKDHTQFREELVLSTMMATSDSQTNEDTNVLDLVTLDPRLYLRFDGEFPYSYTGSKVVCIPDMNGDGRPDIAIGASDVDRAYFVFMTPQYQWRGDVPLYLSTLNGSSGIEIQGVSGSFVGYSFASYTERNGVFIGAVGSSGVASTLNLLYSRAGWLSSPLFLDNITDVKIFDGVSNGIGRILVLTDFNKDNISDLVVMNNYGLRLVFGDPSGWSSVTTAAVNGTNGFYFTSGSDDVEVIVSEDLNSDGYYDIILGLPYKQATYGEIHVVYGHSGPWELYESIIRNGTNGFNIYANSGVGSAIGMALGSGNLDGKANAIVIGSMSQSIYVIFRPENSTWPSDIYLDDLNTPQGIKGCLITCSYKGTYENGFGETIGILPDVNGDYIDELVIGVKWARPLNRSSAGMVIVLYGRPDWPESMVINLDNPINSTIGVEIYGEDISSGSFGTLISTGFDSDGVPMLVVGAPYASFDNKTDVGRVYVISGLALYGNIAVVNKGFVVFNGKKMLLSTSDISALVPNNPELPITFIVDKIEHGFFVNSADVKVSTFSQEEVTASQISFVSDGSNEEPSCTLVASATLNGKVVSSNPVNVSLDFVYSPILASNTLTVESSVVPITSSFLRAIDFNWGNVTDYVNPNLLFEIVNSRHGYFMANGEAVTVIRQSQILAKGVTFVLDDSNYLPSYFVTVTKIDNGVNLTTEAIPAVVSCSFCNVEGSSSSKFNKPVSMGAIIGGVIAGAVLVIGGGVFGVLFWRHQRHKQKEVGASDVHLELAAPVVAHDVSGIPKIDKAELTIIKILGQGGFGTVSLGRWKDITVAVKQLNPGMDMLANTLDDFVKEAVLMNKLRHPNIVQIMGLSATWPYLIVMEYMSHGSLDTLLRNHGNSLTLRQLLNIMNDCAIGLSFLHDRGILHRDVKTGNVLLDENWRAKWTDFGISRLVEGEARDKTKTKGQGTVLYMAPEILAGKTKYDSAVDVFSFAIVLWEAITRSEPYAELENQFAVYDFVMRGERLVIPEELLPSRTERVPVRYASLIRHCWAQNAEERVAMNEVSSEIKAIMSEEASHATP